MAKTEVDTDPLAFSEKKQTALLGHAITDRLFFMQVRSHLRPNWFTSPKNAQLYNALERFYDRAGRFPSSKEELRHSQEITREDPKVANGIRDAFLSAEMAMGDFKSDLLIKEFGLWARTVIFQETVDEAVASFNARKPEQALVRFKEGFKAIQQAEYIGVDPIDWDLDAFTKEQKSDLENAITFGCPQLDAKLNPNAEEGALLKGDTTVIEAPSNIGKTTCLVTVIAHNLFRGKRVLYLTHEGRPADIKFKVLCCLLQVTREEFLRYYSKSECFKTLARYWQSHISSHLTYLAYNVPMANIRDVEALIRQAQERCKLNDPQGRGFDLMVDDYPALLNTDAYLKGQIPKRINDEQVYGVFVSLALELSLHGLLAIQTNREGSKINRGQGTSNRLLTMEDVAESFGVMMKATNVLTMNRTPLDMKNSRVTYYLCKSRSSETDWAFSCQSNYAKSTTHAPPGWPEITPKERFGKDYVFRPGEDPEKYGCTAYRGSTAMTDKLDALISQYRDRGEIPEEALIAAKKGRHGDD